MAVLNINFDEVSLKVQNAFIACLGERFTDIIRDRISKTKYFPYYTIYGLQKYYHYLKKHGYDTLEYELCINEMQSKKDEIALHKMQEAYNKLYQLLPLELQRVLDNSTMSEIQKMELLVGDYVIHYYNDIKGCDFGFVPSSLQYFSFKYDLKLKSLSLDKSEAYKILSKRSTFIENLAYSDSDIPNLDRIADLFEQLHRIPWSSNISSDAKLSEIIDELSYLLKKVAFAPTSDFADQYERLIENFTEEAYLEFIKSSKSFKEIINILGIERDSFRANAIYKIIKNHHTCTVPEGSYADFYRYVFFGLNKSLIPGILDYGFVHELLHALDMVPIFGLDVQCGFETALDAAPRNPYDKRFRKYERLNETINDIFAIEITLFLHSNGIYIFEKPELVNENLENVNTSSILKNMLRPIISRFREEVLDAKIVPNQAQLFGLIGEDNFEELNDIINKTDYLLHNGLSRHLNGKEPNEEKYTEYQDQLNRLANVYAKIDERTIKPGIKPLELILK